MIHLATNHGTGDTYMTLAFAKAHERRIEMPICVRMKEEHKAIADMFPDVMTAYSGVGGMILCHPTHFQGDISRFALLGRPTTHADLWRAMLDLPLDEPMVRGQYEHKIMRMPRRVFMITDARSWPNHHPEFWHSLITRLKDTGWSVRVNRPESSLAEVFHECSEAEWVIGPQCGVMAIICHAMFPCRKTICTPAVEGTGWIVPTTYPYAYVTTFAGEDYGDVEEVRIYNPLTATINNIMRGPHFNRVPVKPELISEVAVKITPGDFFDRLSVLELKVRNLPPAKAASVYREYLRYCELVSPLIDSSIAYAKLYADLLIVNGKAWDHNETAVPDALANRPMQDHHAAAIRLNKERVRLKNQINELCGSASQEIKSYYKDQS